MLMTAYEFHENSRVKGFIFHERERNYVSSQPLRAFKITKALLKSV